MLWTLSEENGFWKRCENQLILDCGQFIYSILTRVENCFTEQLYCMYTFKKNSCDRNHVTALTGARKRSRDFSSQHFTFKKNFKSIRWVNKIFSKTYEFWLLKYFYILLTFSTSKSKIRPALKHCTLPQNRVYAFNWSRKRMS